MVTPTDGQAVAFVRALLQEEGVRSDPPWRTTVVSDDDGWVVRTWTQTPGDVSRPVGRPQFVHRVRTAPGSDQGLRAKLEWSGHGTDER